MLLMHVSHLILISASNLEHEVSPASVWRLLLPAACDAALVSPLNITISLGPGCAGRNRSGQQQGRTTMVPHQPWAHSHHQHGSEGAFSHGCGAEEDAELSIV